METRRLPPPGARTPCAAPFAEQAELLAAAQKDDSLREQFRGKFAHALETVFGSQFCYRYRAWIPRLGDVAVDLLLFAASARTLGQEFTDLAPVVPVSAAAGARRRQEQNGGQNYIAETVPGPVTRTGYFLVRTALALCGDSPAAGGADVLASALAPRAPVASATLSAAGDVLQLLRTLNRVAFFWFGTYESLADRIFQRRARSLGGIPPQAGGSPQGKQTVASSAPPNSGKLSKYFYALGLLSLVRGILVLRRILTQSPAAAKWLLILVRKLKDRTRAASPASPQGAVSGAVTEHDYSAPGRTRSSLGEQLDAPPHYVGSESQTTARAPSKSATLLPAAAPDAARISEPRREKKRGARKKCNIICQICYSECELPTSTVCGHVFCWECAVSWVSTQRNCPLCRAACEPQALWPLWHGA